VHEIFERRQAAIRHHGKDRNDGNPTFARGFEFSNRSRGRVE
jgi:hypothetical protein